jgi:hypothetical protein
VITGEGACERTGKGLLYLRNKEEEEVYYNCIKTDIRGLQKERAIRIFSMKPRAEEEEVVVAFS